METAGVRGRAPRGTAAVRASVRPESPAGRRPGTDRRRGTRGPPGPLPGPRRAPGPLPPDRGSGRGDTPLHPPVGTPTPSPPRSPVQPGPEPRPAPLLLGRPTSAGELGGEFPFGVLAGGRRSPGRRPGDFIVQGGGGVRPLPSRGRSWTVPGSELRSPTPVLGGCPRGRPRHLRVVSIPIALGGPAPGPGPRLPSQDPPGDPPGTPPGPGPPPGGPGARGAPGGPRARGAPGPPPGPPEGALWAARPLLSG